MHAMGAVPTQVPCWHASVWVQALPSSHAEPGAVLTTLHPPDPAKHRLTVHGLPSSGHSLGRLLEHAPVLQNETVVHASLSSQGVSSVAFWATHPPVAGSHTLTLHSMPNSGHVISTPAVHSPLWHVVDEVHASLSSHAVASSSALFLQPATLSHDTLTHGFDDSSHVTGLPWHWPPWHRSPAVQASSSLQSVLSAACESEQPLSGLHEAKTHGVPGVGHETVAPPPHVPFWQDVS